MAADNLQGQVIGDALLAAPLARGGMSVTYEGHHRLLDVPVVVKVLDPVQAWGKPALVEAFLREARTLGQVIHPNVVRVYGAGEQQRIPFLVMERVPGGSLRARLRQGSLGHDQAIELVTQAATGLGVAHAKGIAHGDVKPDNLLLDDEGRVKVVDFGLARFTDRPLEDRGHAVYGTPAYMAPELARGQPCDARSDVYALGVLLYECLVDRWPFNAPEPRRLLQKHLEEEPDLAPLKQAGVPRPVIEVVARCLAKEPDERPEDAGALADELREAAQDDGKPGKRVRASGKRQARGRARPGKGGKGGGSTALVVTIVVCLAALAAVAFFALRR